MSDAHDIPVLYSFRRCPYAMRARMALYSARTDHEHREVVLRDKPEHLIQISPKATVPVLQLPGGDILEESLDIMFWALKKNDPDNWLGQNAEKAHKLISRNDGPFKKFLDRYKYPDRFEEEDSCDAREKGLEILKDLNALIEQNGYLNGDSLSLADIAIFPFIRQFAHVDLNWFNHQPLEPLQNWLEVRKKSRLFEKIMFKTPQWQPKQEPLKIYF